jgi:hypothetical protein
MNALPFGPGFKGMTVIDAGCGDSGDVDIVVENGGMGIGYDLFPRRETYEFGATINRKALTWKRSSQFKIQDICERWPNEDQSVDAVISNALA